MTQTTVVTGLEFKIYLIDCGPCPDCGYGLGLIDTESEWKYYCRQCNVRSNSWGQIYKG